uniref:Uncharacterized protein n=1 Tax=Rhipicephalus zambeziensis TaxID=60191 RepID=A0A224Y7D4_9ACAR
MQSSIIQPSVQSDVAVQTTKQGSTIQQINRFPPGIEVNIPIIKNKSHLSTAPQKAQKSANQTAQYHTQVWLRNEFGTPSSQAKQQGTSQQMQPQKASSSDKSMHNEKQRPTCTHRKDVLNSSWDRIIVSSDVASKLPLQEIRRGIKTFLESRVDQQMVFEDRMLRLHWDGEDLGTFQYKDAVTSTPTITIEDEIIISSSDDEVIEVDTATPVTPPTVGTSHGVTHDPHVTAVGSKKSSWKGIKDHLVPHVILIECASSDSEDCSDRDDLSDDRKAPKSSDEEPTYSPDEDLGTFQYKDAVTSTPTITIEDEIIISSSDDEVIEVDTATPVTPLTVGTSHGVTHDPHVTAVGSKKSSWKGIKDHLVPHVILIECASSDSEDCSDRDDLSDDRKAPKSSDEEPTYSPDEDLGTFQYKDAVTSTPTITIEDEIIISSSDDEVIEVDTATPVTPLTVGMLHGVTHDPHVTAVGSKKSSWKGIKDPLGPHVILAECSSSDSEDSSDRDDLSDERKAPTYSPDEEEISSEDNTSPDNSDSEVCSKPSAGSFVDPSARSN